MFSFITSLCISLPTVRSFVRNGWYFRRWSFWRNARAYRHSGSRPPTSNLYAHLSCCILAPTNVHRLAYNNLVIMRMQILTHECNIVNCSLLWNKMPCCGLCVHVAVMSRFLPELPPCWVTNSAGISSSPSPRPSFTLFSLPVRAPTPLVHVARRYSRSLVRRSPVPVHPTKKTENTRIDPFPCNIVRNLWYNYNRPYAEKKKNEGEEEKSTRVRLLCIRIKPGAHGAHFLPHVLYIYIYLSYIVALDWKKLRKKTIEKSLVCIGPKALVARHWKKKRETKLYIVYVATSIVRFIGLHMSNHTRRRIWRL